MQRAPKEPLKFIVLEYKGSKPAETGKPLALIGKSTTFDSGGISLKPSDGMEKMKYDMAGGAAVLGVLKAASALKLPVNLIGILPATEKPARRLCNKTWRYRKVNNGQDRRNNQYRC